MKNLIILIALLSCVGAKAQCNLVLKKKKSTAKTLYLENGNTIGQKTLAKLDGICTYNVEVMTVSELRTLKMKRLKRQLAKLKAE